MTLKAKKILFICLDMQERLLPAMARHDEILKNTRILLESAHILDIPTLITEQYPKGLGRTIETLKIPQNTHILAKTSFGIFDDADIKAHIGQSKRKTLVFFGIESHICVLQSIMQAQNLGYKCLLAADATSSRKESAYHLALEFLRFQGVGVLPTESILFSILGDSAHTSFKTISALVKDE
ncbi:isochorismatase family protein [Helicobacter jaachi]|nr:isochorismatase family protein [Helicobacter jaachi]